VIQVQDLVFGLVDPHTTDLSSSIQSVQIPLYSLPNFQQIDTPAQLDIIRKLTEGALNPLIQITDKDVKQDWPQNRALGNTTCDRLPAGFNSIHTTLWARPASQFLPSKEYTCQSHELPAFLGECCGRQYEKLY